MRVVAELTGVLLLAGGLLALCAGLGALGSDAADAAVLSAATERYVRGHDWFWPLAGAVAELVALSGLAGLAGTVRDAVRRRRPSMDGATRMHARAASGDLIEDAARLPGVRDVRVRLAGTAARPRLVIDVECASDARPGDVHAALGGEPVDRFRDALGMRTLVVAVRYRLASGSEAPDASDGPDGADAHDSSPDAEVDALAVPRARRRRRAAADVTRATVTGRDAG
ncbi:hypothetical protein [Actinomadura gamaensis]|uniref:Alkaline shock response membrane anchor protein AmaP n=1 Tax=Actinomadura gamaensis TaxID=1763541 RepID=A0ABV9UD23_9ACTN